MVILFRQAARGFWRGKRSFAACILLVALGVASYVGFTQTSYELLATVDSLYATQDFADAFASVAGIPENGVHSLALLDGIEEVSATAEVSVRVLSAGDELLSLNIMSHNELAALDRFMLLEGSMPGRGQIAVNRAFFDARELEFGQELELSSGGRLIRAQVSGIIASPAHIVPFGDTSTSGFACMELEPVQYLSGITGLYNALSFRLSPGTSYEDVEAHLDAALERYGLISLYGRDDHPSHYSTIMSFSNLEDMSGVIASLFFGVAVLVLYILLRRVIEQERTQIGTMKAMGIGNGPILGLYIGYGAIIGLSGAVIGVGLGLLITVYFVTIYKEIFVLPSFFYPLDLSLLFTSLTLSLLTGVFGAAIGARSVLKLHPAEAMRPAAPPSFKQKARSRPSRLPLTVTMALRGISRARFRSAFIAGGIAVSYMILTFMSSYASIMDDLMMTQFSKSLVYDLHISLAAPKPYTAAVQSAMGLEGVSHAEALLQLPAEFRHMNLKREGTVTGLRPQSTLRRLYDSDLEVFVPVPESGVIITKMLSERIGAVAGDTIMMTVGSINDDERPVVVTGVVGANEGVAAFFSLDNLCDALEVGSSVNTLMLNTDDAPAVMTFLDEAANIAGMTDMGAMQRIWQADLDGSLGVNVGIFAVMGLGVAFAVIISTATISLSERSREYATLRVLGFSPGEIGRTLLLEYFILSLIGFIPGIPMSVAFRVISLSQFAGDSVSITWKIGTIHFIVGGIVCLLVALIANLSSIRRIARLEMTEVLKERE